MRPPGRVGNRRTCRGDELKQFSVRPEERVRSVKPADRHMVCHHTAESLAWKQPGQVKSRRLDLERWLAQLCQVEVNRVVGYRADRGRDTGKRRECGTMNVAGGNELYARMTPDDRREFAGIEQVLAVHMPDAGREWRMVQEQQCRPLRCRCER